MDNKLYMVVEENMYCETGVVGYIEEEYSDGVVKFSKVDSDNEIFIPKYCLKVAE